MQYFFLKQVKFITPAVLLTLDYILPVLTHSIAYKSINNIFTRLELKNEKISIFCFFFVIFELAMNQKCFKLVAMYTSQCVLPIPINSMALRGITNNFYGFRLRKMQKNNIFCSFLVFFLAGNEPKMLQTGCYIYQLVCFTYPYQFHGSQGYN